MDSLWIRCKNLYQRNTEDNKKIDVKETIHTVVLFIYTNFYQFVDQNAWIKENYPKDMRYESIIVYSKNGTSGNILTAASIQYVRIL